MNTNTITESTQAADLEIARRVMAEYADDNTLAERLLVVKKMVAVEATVQEREDYTFTYTPGYVRRGFRQMALRMEAAERWVEANAFWALRDDIDTYDGQWDERDEVI